MNGQNDKWMDEQKSPCVLQDFVSFGDAAQKAIKAMGYGSDSDYRWSTIIDNLGFSPKCNGAEMFLQIDPPIHLASDHPSATISSPRGYLSFHNRFIVLTGRSWLSLLSKLMYRWLSDKAISCNRPRWNWQRVWRFANNKLILGQHCNSKTSVNDLTIRHNVTDHKEKPF